MDTFMRDEGLQYLPPPAIEPWFTAEFEKRVPLCANGKDRKLRFVWGCDRLEYCGGFWERRYEDSDHNPPKYVGRARWILEGWQPSDIYDREEWERKSHLLGEWPSQGVFDFIAFHTTNDGGYLPLNQAALNHVKIWAHWQNKGRKASVEELLDAKFALRMKRHKERKAASDRIATQFGEEVVKCFENSVDPVSTSGKDIKFMNGAFEQTPSGIIVPRN